MNMDSSEIISTLKRAPYFSKELIKWWKALSDEEKSTYLNTTIVFVDSHRDKSFYQIQSVVQAIVRAFCYQKNRELTYEPELFVEQNQIEILEACEWI